MTSPRDRIHPTAIISSEAELADDVRVGPFAIIDGCVRVGAGSIIHGHAHLIGPITMGRDNQVYPNAVLGGRPQHAGFRDEVTSIEIGDGNIFRECVTIHRGTTAAYVTRIGNSNTFMCGSHVGHDCVVGNHCTLVNNALLGGHCLMEDGAIISGNSCVHQFCRLGRLSFMSGASGTSKDMPPFIIQHEINIVAGVNLVGMRRAGFRAEQINAVRRLYRIVYLQRLALPNALAKVQAELGHVDVVREFIEFVRNSKRGINRARAEATELAA
jgi:UDP-N-acetylglucosamine acyltransferase